jgi:hypothetical protein
VEESEQWHNFYQLLFRDKELELQTPLYLQLSVLGQRAVAQAASAHWDRLLEFLRKIKDLEIRSPLDTLLKLIHSGNRNLKALVRQYVLDSVPFRDPAVLERVSRSDAAVELGLRDDADLRARNLRLRVNIPPIFISLGEQLTLLSARYVQREQRNRWRRCL